MQTLIGWLGRATSFGLFHSPAWVRRGLANILAFLWFDVLRIRRGIILNNIAIAFPNLSKRERIVMGRQSMRHLGLNIIEYSFLPWLNKDNYLRYFAFENSELLNEILSRGKGALFLTLHLGHGDLACAAMSLQGWPVVIVSKFFKWKWLNDLWFGMRERSGTRFVAPRDSSFALLRVLKKGSIIVLPLDQFTGPPIGVRTTFFGKETGTAAGLAVMSERSGTPVVAVYTHRDPSGRHVLHFVKEMPSAPEGQAADITGLTQSYNFQLENFVRLHPEQWMWLHRRWKKFVVGPRAGIVDT